MSEYIHFTEEQKEKANSVNIIELLRSMGEGVIKSGREWRMKSDSSITVRNNTWYDHSKEKGGKAISFLMENFNESYQNAVQILLGNSIICYTKPKKEIKAKDFILPKQNRYNSRVYDYLVKHRKIDKEIIDFFVYKLLIYEDAVFHNAVFVGKDTTGSARHAHKRSTNLNGKAFRINVEGSNPEYSFNYIGKSNTLYVFEAPIDLLSYISLNQENWHEQNYVALMGTSVKAICRILSEHHFINTIVICLDNDNAGIEAGKRIENEFSKRNYLIENDYPIQKDWNEELIYKLNLKHKIATINLI